MSNDRYIPIPVRCMLWGRSAGRCEFSGCNKPVSFHAQTKEDELGITPNNDGKVIRLNLPPLTEERRRDLVKLVHSRLEDSRIAVRNIRRDLIKDLREFEKEKMISEDDLDIGVDELQKLTDHTIAEIDATGVKKEKEIMEV